ncbi:DUF7122 family protein [Halovenus sp. HT40]|uniref:DUF7122 family protein n=1 Tax=Halovenus sp. HT40 TaxID=3126691 RepID=UPI00300F71AB
MTEEISTRFDRLPATDAERTVEQRATREEVVGWFDERFGIGPSVFEEYSFWERGAGKIWAFYGDLESPVDIEGLGMTVLRTRQEHWKPTLEAVQRFGHHATKNTIHLSREQATQFMAGDDQQVDWEGDWGYLIVTHDLAGEPEPLGVGLYTYDELKSTVPKGRRREL